MLSCSRIYTCSGALVASGAHASCHELPGTHWKTPRCLDMTEVKAGLGKGRESEGFSKTCEMDKLTKHRRKPDVSFC